MTENQKLTDFQIGDIVKPATGAPWAAQAKHTFGDATRLRVVGIQPSATDPEIGNLYLNDTETGRPFDYIGHLLVEQVDTEPHELRNQIAQYRSELAEVRDVLVRERAVVEQEAVVRRERYDEVCDLLDQARSELEQAEAAQVLEAHRANKAEAAERRAVRLLTYATSLMGARKRGMVQGFASGLDSER